MHSLRMKVFEQFELVPFTISMRSDTNDLYASNKPMTMRCSTLRNNELCPQESRQAHEKAQSTITAIDPSGINQRVTTELCAQAIDSYFADQKRRDNAHKEKIASSKTSDVLDIMKRKEYMRKYMQKKRETESFRKQENSLAQSRMKDIRSTEHGKRQNIERAAEGMKRSRDTSEGKRKNREKAAEGMKSLLNTQEGRLKHNQMSVDTMKKRLSSEEGRQKHKASSAKVWKKLMGTEKGRQKHKIRSVEGMKKMLSTTEKREKHNVRSAEGMKKLLSTEEGRQKHNAKSAEGMKKLLNTEEGRQKHKERSAQGMKQLRKRKNYSEEEHAQRKKRKIGSSFSEAVEKFNEAILGSCSYVCSCCQQLWFKQSVKEVSSLYQTGSMDTSLLKQCLTGYSSVGNREWICNTCVFNIRKGKVPKLSVINGMRFPQKPPELNLSNLEERLIALRIPFYADSGFKQWRSVFFERVCSKRTH